MKLYLFVLCYFILSLQYEIVDGGAVKDFFGNIQDSLHKVRENVRSGLHSHNESKLENSESDYDIIVFREPTKSTQSNKSSDDKRAKSNDVPTVTAAPNVNGTSTEKDGRENFAAGCATGYMRTPDGRCKPTF